MDSYNATVVTSHRGEPTDALEEALFQGLSGYHVAVSALDGRVAATITLPAEGLRQALNSALDVIERALAGLPSCLPLRSVEILPTEDFDQRWDVNYDSRPEIITYR